MPRNDRGLPWRQFAFHHMQVRAAYAASIDAHEQFAFSRLGGGNILVLKRIAFHLRRRLQNTRFHRETSRAATARSTYVYCFQARARNAVHSIAEARKQTCSPKSSNLLELSNLSMCIPTAAA